MRRGELFFNLEYVLILDFQFFVSDEPIQNVVVDCF